MFALSGKKVVGVDVDQKAVDTINDGKIHIVEAGLEEAVSSVVAAGNLKAAMHPEPADVFILAVPTPFAAGYEPDLSYIEAATKAIAPVLDKGNLVILESTSPVGATELMTQWLASARPDLRFPTTNDVPPDVHVAHCPERVLPGQIMRELVENDRIIGGMTQICALKSADLYKTFVKGDCITTNVRTAEMAKLTENSFRDVNIAFANELSMICAELSIDVWELIRLANRHPRVSVLRPGTGVGGHCIAVDPWFIVSSAPEQAKLIRAAREVNNSKPDYVVSEIARKTSMGAYDRVVLLGLSFKPDIDDLRESPAVEVAKKLSKSLKNVDVIEPHIDTLPKSLSNADLRLVEIGTLLKSKNTLIAVLVGHSSFAEFMEGLSVGPDSEILDFCGLLS